MNLAAEATAYLTAHGCPNTATHVARVAQAARRLAETFHMDPTPAETAAWLHDISAVIPTGERLRAALDLGLDVFAEERACPSILHQRLSVIIARDRFGITDPAILSAIGCHTTLKAGASALDKLVFLADKLEWDGADAAPYREELSEALKNSLDHAARTHLTWMHGQRASMQVVHPWLRDAYQELTGRTWEA
ncbi:MAG TPA: bis(5'-nucleosyl)-tetraphosphatase (symmetrical) YqeK [Symbiobacteriaceae bacterium]|nr:bis(5'-nucleosyl)-tetraphosphatase (symmetrical) YqeK [Symbiobacteriaceae bacterium]